MKLIFNYRNDDVPSAASGSFFKIFQYKSKICVKAGKILSAGFEISLNLKQSFEKETKPALKSLMQFHESLNSFQAWMMMSICKKILLIDMIINMLIIVTTNCLFY